VVLIPRPVATAAAISACSWRSCLRFFIKERARKAIILLLAGGLAMTFIVGCSPAARHKVLTVFFTGVPPLGSEESEEVPTKPAVTHVVKKRGIVVMSTRFSHGPYAANACYLCHETSASGGLRGFGKIQEAKSSFAKAGEVSGKLVEPLGELCSMCHESKDPAKAYDAGLWVHGPVSTGNCVLCHAPHSGPEQYMLEKTADALCVDCHEEGTIFNQSEHKDRYDCMSCHNAHLGKDSRLLKADYREPWE
jgi:predicted CXXCH cytochrome family protein